MTDKTIIEINGVKMEIDLRHATRIEHLRVGDRVKVLRKAYSDYNVSQGVIIGFEPFRDLPTIIVAYVETGYATADIKFVYYNANSKDVEIVKSIDNDGLDMSRAQVDAAFDSKLNKLRREIEELEEKRAYFHTNFRAYWQPINLDEQS